MVDTGPWRYLLLLHPHPSSEISTIMEFVDQHDLARSGKNLISSVDPFEKLNLSQTDRKDYQDLTERHKASKL